jgi:endonuclease/exonuclease/phosphatase family metal-dependent hydrolase
MDLKYFHKYVSSIIMSTLQQKGFMCADVGVTYVSDDQQVNGLFTESALDHVYLSESIKYDLSIRTVPNSSSDHYPVIATLKKINSKKHLSEGSLRGV